MIENAIFIEEQKNGKNNKFDSYRRCWYILWSCFDKDRKNNLINQMDLVNAQVYDDKATYSVARDKHLLSILQTNSSKVVDENGEPKVVYHGSNYRPLLSNGKFIASDRAYGKGIYFISTFPEVEAYAGELRDQHVNKDTGEVIELTLSRKDGGIRGILLD